MENRINEGTLNRLLEIHRDDADTAGIIQEALLSFEKYHQAIYELEIRRLMYARGAMDAEAYREEAASLDQIRTNRHNTVISEIRLLNRLAEQSRLPLVYEGTVSEQHPYRTHLADAVLAFVQQVTEDRATGGR